MHLSASSPRVVSRRVNVYSPVLTGGHPPPGTRGRRLASTSSFLLSSRPINQSGRVRPFADKNEPPSQQSTIVIPSWLASNLERDDEREELATTPLHWGSSSPKFSLRHTRDEVASTIPHIHTYTYTGTHAHEQGKDARIRVTIFATKEIQRQNTSLPFDHTRSRIAKSPRFGATHTPHETCRFAAEARDTVPPYPRYLFLLLPLLFHTPLSSEPPPFPRPSWWTVVSPPSCFLVTHSCPLLLHNHPWAALSNSGSISPFPHASALFWPTSTISQSPPPSLFVLDQRSLQFLVSIELNVKFDQQRDFRRSCVARETRRRISVRE